MHLTVRRWRKLPVILVMAALPVLPVLAGAAGASASPVHHPAAAAHTVTHPPKVFVGETLYDQNIGSGRWLHAHCSGCVMDDAPFADRQQWAPYDAQHWNSNHNGSVITVAYRLLGTSLCANYDSSTGNISAQTCVGGTNCGWCQQFWVPHNNSTGGDWLINADASAHTSDHSYAYASEDSGTNFSITIFGNGTDNFSQWTPVCVICS